MHFAFVIVPTNCLIQSLCSNDHHTLYHRLGEIAQNPSTQKMDGLRDLLHDNQQLAKDFQSLFIAAYTLSDPVRRDTEASGSTASSGTEDYTHITGGDHNLAWVEEIGKGVVTNVHMMLNRKTGQVCSSNRTFSMLIYRSTLHGK